METYLHKPIALTVGDFENISHNLKIFLYAHQYAFYALTRDVLVCIIVP